MASIFDKPFKSERDHDHKNEIESDHRPIGVFDSGIGGLTVLKELLKAFPQENFIYLGDTARLPYGSKSGDTVRKYSEQNMKYLVGRGVKALIVACNTASTQVFETEYMNLPVYNVIDPGSMLAYKSTENKIVGILGTRATVNANTYEKKIKNLDSNIEVYSAACPLFVPLAEEGWHDDPITNLIAYRYLNELKDKKPDTVVLGCTHYPLLKIAIQKVFGQHTKLIDSGEAICELLATDFNNERLLPSSKEDKKQLFISLTDFGPQFEILCNRLLKDIVDSTDRTMTFETVSVI